MKDDIIYIEHILQSIDRIEHYLSGKDHRSFSDDFMTQDAVVRQLEIIGEATKRISKDLWNLNPQVPWSDMAGMRDILIHDYIDVDLDIVWKTASESIVNLKYLLLNLTLKGWNSIGTTSDKGFSKSFVLLKSSDYWRSLEKVEHSSHCTHFLNYVSYLLLRKCL